MQTFEEIVAKHMGLMYTASSKYYKSESDREDLIQDTMLRAYKYYDKFEQGTSFKNWICRIMKNVFINQYQRNKMIERKSIGLPIMGTEGGLMGEVGFTHFSAKYLSDEVTHALDKISDEHRNILIALVEEDLEYKDLADKFSIPLGTVMSKLCRARKNARALLLDYARENYQIGYQEVC
jgi:RNA polymerase sigma-70 factor, ECF subfamily